MFSLPRISRYIYSILNLLHVNARGLKYMRVAGKFASFFLYIYLPSFDSIMSKNMFKACIVPGLICIDTHLSLKLSHFVLFDKIIFVVPSNEAKRLVRKLLLNFSYLFVVESKKLSKWHVGPDFLPLGARHFY